MIRINLLGGERQKAKKAVIFDVAARTTAACSLILVLTAVGLGYWYWYLNRASAQVDADIAAAQQETARLQSLLADVRNFEAQRTQLQQRVALIEQLRSGQSIPVMLLDHISRSLPDMLWLLTLEQKGNDITIEGRSTTLIALSDFVGNLGNGTLLQKPIEIVNSQVEPVAAGAAAAPGAAPIEVIRFTVKATLAPQTTAPAAAAATAAPPAPAAGGGR
jgi:type IV pilus assembly protein PilN